MLDPQPSLAPPARAPLAPRQQLRIVGLAAGALVALVLLIGLVRALTHRAEPAPPAPPPGTFRPTAEQLAQMNVQLVRDGSTADVIAATGQIAVDENKSTPVLLPFSGQVTDVLVQAGQRVVRGQPLLRVSSPEYLDARTTLLSASAQQATAAAQLKVAGDNARRQQAIYQTAGGALKDYRQAQSDLVTAQSTLKSADAALDAARGRLAILGKNADQIAGLRAAGPATSAQTAYDAPVSGVIATRDVAPGQYVGSGGDKPLMTIADLSDVWLVAQLPESDTAAVKLGDVVDVTTPAYPGRSFRAVVDNIAASLDPATHRLPVRATVANPDGSLKPQMFANFQIRRRAARGVSGLLVPSGAVIHEGDTARVWVLTPDRLLRAQTVTVGDSVGGYDAITAGLRPGDRIVTAGALFVNEAGLGG